MDFWIFSACAVLLILAYPYLRIFVKRLVLLYKLKSVCRKNGFVLHRAHTLAIFGTRNGSICDLYIETSAEVFAVKLFAMGRHKTVLIFKENGQYFVRSFLAFVSNIGGAVRFPINSRPKQLPSYNFRYGYKNDWEIKTPRNILLINPVCLEMRRQPIHGGEVILGSGDVVNGMEIYSLSRFLKYLER